MSCPAPSAGNHWSPLPRQEVFLRCPAREAFYGGAGGAGKTDALLIDAAALVANPHHRAILFRRTKVDLLAWVIPRSYELYPALGGVWMAARMTWRFPSGATIQLSGADSEGSIRKFAGNPYNWIGFDELTHFTAWQYTFMLSRNRSAHGLPCYIRSASNPGGPGHDWVLARWAAWLYPPGHEDYHGLRALADKVLWMLTDNEGVEQAVAPGTRFAISRTFIPGKLADNPFLDGNDDYRTALMAMSLLDRLQILNGDWMARPCPGLFFKRGWWKFVDACPSNPAMRLRYWDLAATAAALTTPERAWTAGGRFSRVDVGKGSTGFPISDIYIEDFTRLQGSPHEVEQHFATTAETDLQFDATTDFWIERDPGQAGVTQAYHYATSMAARATPIVVKAIPPRGDKVQRAKIPSALVQVGRVFVVRGRWNEGFIARMERFPEPPVDETDVVSGAFAVMLPRGARKGSTPGAADPSRNIYRGPGASTGNRVVSAPSPTHAPVTPRPAPPRPRPGGKRGGGF